jgi:hypothetical protein
MSPAGEKNPAPNGSPSLLDICETLSSFHEIQLEKFRDNMRKPGWRATSIDELIDALDQEVQELKLAVKEDNFNEAGREAADVANRAMIIADRLGQLKWQPNASS